MTLKCTKESIGEMITDIEARGDDYKEDIGMFSQKAVLAALRLVRNLIDGDPECGVLVSGSDLCRLFYGVLDDIDPMDEGYGDLHRVGDFLICLQAHWARQHEMEVAFTRMGCAPSP